MRTCSTRVCRKWGAMQGTPAPDAETAASRDLIGLPCTLAALGTHQSRLPDSVWHPLFSHACRNKPTKLMTSLSKVSSRSAPTNPKMSSFCRSASLEAIGHFPQEKSGKKREKGNKQRVTGHQLWPSSDRRRKSRVTQRASVLPTRTALGSGRDLPPAKTVHQARRTAQTATRLCERHGGSVHPATVEHPVAGLLGPRGAGVSTPCFRLFFCFASRHPCPQRPSKLSLAANAGDESGSQSLAKRRRGGPGRG